MHRFEDDIVLGTGGDLLRVEADAEALHQDKLRREAYGVLIGALLDLREADQIPFIAEFDPARAALLDRVIITDGHEALLAPEPGPNGEPGACEPVGMSLEALSGLVRPAMQIFMANYDPTAQEQSTATESGSVGGGQPMGLLRTDIPGQ